MVSYYNFSKNFGYSSTLNEMIIDGKDFFPVKWQTHVKEWLTNPYNAEIITIRYEDLLNQPLIELKKICNFINIARSEDLLQRVIDGNQIDKMRQRVKDTGGMGHKAWQGEKGEQFFRSGKSGTYQRDLCDELIHFFNKEPEKQLSLFNYKI